MIGGVVTDEHGRSTLPGLYAVGECACTGRARSQPARLELALGVLRLRAPRGAGRARTSRAPRREQRRRRRRARRPARRGHAGGALWQRRGAGARRGRASSAWPPIRIRSHALIARSALARSESRGCHLRSDFPDVDPALDSRHLREPSETAGSLD